MKNLKIPIFIAYFGLIMVIFFTIFSLAGREKSQPAFNFMRDSASNSPQTTNSLVINSTSPVTQTPRTVLGSRTAPISITGPQEQRLATTSIPKSPLKNKIILSAPAVMAPTTSEKSRSLIWGAYNGYTVADGANFEKLVGAKMKTRAIFIHWGNENAFPTAVANSLKADKQILTIYWEAKDYNVAGADQPDYSYRSILAGNWDEYITSFAAAAQTSGVSIILIPFEEMNDNGAGGQPWSGLKNGNTPADEILAYRYIRKFFTGVNNVKFGWAVNALSVPNKKGNRIADYYPGDAYVDYVGVDGFNFGDPWQTFDEIFSSALSQLASYHKPIFIFSLASAAGPDKAAWITDAFNDQIKIHPEIAGWIWFNENKEENWLVNSDTASLAAFRTAVAEIN